MKGKLFAAAAAAVAAVICVCSLRLEPMPDTPSDGDAAAKTPITGAARISEADAEDWARERGAAELFIELAPLYWEYGERTGIRPEVMYAQAALETALGNFGGRVTPDMNNFAGIKRVDAAGDAREDHESFPTPSDGVRAHYNHMCAYTGLEPIGIPHDRYYLVLGTDWAGTVKYAEELGGRWCPDADYGEKLTSKFLNDMLTRGQ